MNPSLSRALSPTPLGPIRLRNRVIKAATFEGMSPGGIPSPQLTRHHARLAQGGVGITTVAYGAVSAHGRTFSDQLLVGPKALAGLTELTDAVHSEGGAASLQLAHCGGFTKNRAITPRGPSWNLNLYGILSGLPWVHPMRTTHIDRVIADFAQAAERAAQAGFDAVELHLGHGYLLSQFLSPRTNRRRDRFGLGLAGRMRLPLAVVDAVRDAVGQDLAVLAKINLSDGLPGGSGVEEAVVLTRALEERGIDAVIMSGGVVSRNAFYLLRGGRPLRAMIRAEHSLPQKAALALFGPFLVRPHRYRDLFFLEQAQRLRAASAAPLALLGGVASSESVTRAMDEGFDYVVMGRALLSNPDFVHEMASGEPVRARCNHCNLCVAEMDRDGVRCVLSPP